jgi:hypothetical protein
MPKVGPIAHLVARKPRFGAINATNVTSAASNRL